MIYVEIGDKQVLTETVFPVGETKLELYKDAISTAPEVRIKWLYDNDSEIFRIVALVQEIREINSIRGINYVLTLHVPYFPYARMDRVKTEVNTLKALTKLINDLKFDKVIINDAHSDVVMALLNNVVQRKWTESTSMRSHIDSDTVIVFPDVTAEKRYASEFERVKGSITCMKTRDFKTGKIESLLPITTLDLNADWSKTRFVMVDDLCSYGGTFDLAINKIRELIPTAKHFELVVGHLEKVYLEGKLVDNPYFKRVWTRKTLGWQETVSTELSKLFKDKKVSISSL